MLSTADSSALKCSQRRHPGRREKVATTPLLPYRRLASVKILSQRTLTSHLRTRSCCSCHHRRAPSLSTYSLLYGTFKNGLAVDGEVVEVVGPRGLGDNGFDFEAEALDLVRHLRPDPGVAAREKASWKRTVGDDNAVDPEGVPVRFEHRQPAAMTQDSGDFVEDTPRVGDVLEHPLDPAPGDRCFSQREHSGIGAG